MTTLAEDPRAKSIKVLLNRVPDRWEEYDPDSLTEIESKVLGLLIGSGMIETRRRFRFRMMNQPMAISATITVTGEYGGVEALEPLFAATWEEWREPYEEWLKSDAAKTVPFHCQTLKPAEWRITEEGQTAKSDLVDNLKRVSEYVLKQGNSKDRFPTRGQGRLIEFTREEALATLPDVNAKNLEEIAAAMMAAFEAKYSAKPKNPGVRDFQKTRDDRIWELAVEHRLQYQAAVLLPIVLGDSQVAANCGNDRARLPTIDIIQRVLGEHRGGSAP